NDPPYSILDLDCGPGRDLHHFRLLGHNAVGLDGSTEFVAMARSYSGCQVLHHDFLTMILPESRFDGVFANASLFHVPSRELPRVLLFFATHLPRRTTRVPRRGKIMERAGPCFPGYLFVLLDLAGEAWKAATYTRGVLRLLPVSERPLPVETSEVLELHQAELDGALDERDAFGLDAGENGRALADDQRLFPEPSTGRLRADRPSNGLNPWRIKRMIAADRGQCVFAAIAAGARFASGCARSLAFLRVFPIGGDLLR